MPVFVFWRRSSAVWLMPLTGLVVATFNNNQLGLLDGYPPFLASQKMASLIIIGLIAAGTGAAEGAWTRRSQLLRLPSSRSFLGRFAPPILKTWLPTAVLLMAGVIAVGGISAWQIWSTGLLSLLAWVCIGFAFGVALRPVISVPLAVVAAFGWFAFTPSIDPPWLRHLSGRWSYCCNMASVPSWSVVIGVTAAALAFISASLIVVQVVDSTARWRLVKYGLAGLVAVSGIAVAGAVTNTSGYLQSQPRTDQPICVSGTPKLCFWPERAGYLPEAETQVRTLLDRWLAVGVTLADTMSESALNTPAEGVGLLTYAHAATVEERTNWLAEGIAAWCSSEAGERYEGLGFYQVKDWLVHQIGADLRVSDPDGLNAVLALPPGEQLRKVNDALSQARRCQ